MVGGEGAEGRCASGLRLTDGRISGLNDLLQMRKYTLAHWRYEGRGLYCSLPEGGHAYRLRI